MKILLPVDGSPCSASAVKALLARLRWFAGPVELHLLHVHLPIPMARPQGAAGHQQVEAYYREEGEAQLAPVAAILKAADQAFTPHIHVGQPAEVIAKFAREQGCDLICMGSHGRTALMEAVMGSVASRVLQVAPCPVMLLK